jgi:hypothetical protein
MPQQSISLPELLLLVAYLSFPVWCLARILQWLLLKNLLPAPRLIITLLVSILISFIITIVLWGGWPGKTMYSIISAPALCAEGMVLLMTYFIKKSLIKK